MLTLLPAAQLTSVFQVTARICLLGWFAATGLASVAKAASDDTSTAIDYPLVVVNAASVQRLRENARFMFEAAEHPEMVAAVDKWTDSTLKELKGIDRTRPFGMMLYLPASFVGSPVGISYVPITDLDDALLTLAYGTGTVTAVDGKKGYNNIRYGESFLVRTRRIGGYLFLGGPDASEALMDKNFPDPMKLASRLTSQYDFAISLQIKNVPPNLKSIFLESLKMSSQAELQQRDDEPESAYRLRRANGDSWLELVDKIVTQGEEFTIGARMDAENHKANIDFEIAGTSDSKLAKFFQDMAGKQTYFGNLLTNPSTFTMSASVLLTDKQRPLLTSFFDAAKKDIGKQAEKNNNAGASKVIDPIFKVLTASADAGHLDAVAQLVGNEPGKFALIAGAKLMATRNLPNQMTELMQFVKDSVKGEGPLAKLEIGVNEIDSFPVHRMEVKPPDKAGQTMFGEVAHLYLYASTQAVWVAFGGDSAMDALREAVGQVALPKDPQQSRNRVPLLFVTHANNWLTVANDENAGAKAFNDLARDAFKSENDSMQLVVRPTDSGVRLRVEFEEGFIALMGRGFSKGIEQGIFNGQRNRQNRLQNARPALPPPQQAP